MEEIRFDPIERKEFFLAKLGGQEVTPPDAVTRIEHYLQDIIDGNASTIPPITKMEYYLAKISGADVTVPDPVTRTEYYLAKIAGMDVEPPDPITRLDYFLAQWVETGGGVLETVTGNAPIILADALAKRLVSLKQYGKCETSGGKTYCNNGEVKARVDDHAEIYVDGTPEVLTVVGKNLLNSATNVEGSYISATGVITDDNSTPPKSQYTDLIPVIAGEKYTWSLSSNRATSGNNRWHGYDANGDWVQQIAFDSSGTGGEAFELTATIPSGVVFVRLSYGATDTDAQLEHGETATAYQAYSAQTATVPDLFATNEVADEVDLISGVVTRKTEVTVSAGAITITALGTPVTESVTPQPMVLEEGTNIVTVAAEVSPIELKAEYARAAS